MTPRRRQRGATLVVALIFLVLMSLFAVNAFLGAGTSLRVVGNMQARNEALAAAQVAIEQVVSTAAVFTTDTSTVSPIAVDIDRNGSTDYTVAFSPAPTCFRVRPVKNTELDQNVATDLACVRSGSLPMSGIELPSAAAAGLLADNSLCVSAEWNIRAEATDSRTGARVAVNQGVAVRMMESDAATYCK